MSYDVRDASRAEDPDPAFRLVLDHENKYVSISNGILLYVFLSL